MNFKQYIFFIILPVIILNHHHILSKSQQFVLPLMQVKTGHLRWAGGSLDKCFLQQIKQISDAKFFIETGTYAGDSSATALEVFDEVHTIELSKIIFEQACKRFENNAAIFLYCGDSTYVLPKILSTINEKSVLWLDGHWSSGATARGEVNTPIIQELQALKKSRLKNSIILIDDIRFFQTPIIALKDKSLEGYPTIHTVIEYLKDINSYYTYYVYADILIASDIDITVAPIIQAMTISRLNKENDTALFEAETIISNCNGNEAELIKNLCKDFEDDGGHGFNRYYHFWYALTLLNRNRPLAYYHMTKAFEAGCQRADYYLETWQ